jgi:endoglucanase
MNFHMLKPFSIALAGTLVITSLFAQNNPELKLNDREYFEMPGLNVMAFQDIYPEGHQGGISIIQNGVRIATNGNILLEPVPGQWQPVAKMTKRVVDKQNNEIRVSLVFPDSARNRKGFNPISYPDLYFNYTIKVKSEGSSVRITVDLDRALPKEWIGKVGFTMELYPADLFGKTWILDQQSGIFPRQSNGPVQKDDQGEVQPVPYAIGKRLTIAPENDAQRMAFESKKTDIQLLDGRIKYNNGWFIVRSLVPAGATVKAIDWLISPNAIAGWKYKPVIHVSQVGYHPNQQKIAVLELDASDTISANATLVRISENDNTEESFSSLPKYWGKFLRYNYYQFDFTAFDHEGMYYIRYNNSRTEPFRISREVYQRHVWQPVLEYFLPIQMCHMRVNENYRVWHGVCHLDDALMAPVDINHFDGYLQGPKTLCKYKPQEPVPGLNAGGWHDAGDDDLRIESQAGEVFILSLIYESFHIGSDNTTIDQENKLVEIHRPDGKPDILQQVEHGMINILGAYRNMGRLYRGIICPTLDQYVLMGDVSNQTDNLVYDPKLKSNEHNASSSGKNDDRWVFTEDNPRREYEAIADIAAAARVLKGYNNPLSDECLSTSEKLWNVPREMKRGVLINKIHAAIELFLTTGKDEYKQFIISYEDSVKSHISELGWLIGRVLPKLNDVRFSKSIGESVATYAVLIKKQQQQNPFGVPYRPYIWGAGWSIQKFGVDQYFLHTGFPEQFDKEYMLNALNFVMGCHPGENTSSFASGVGARSQTIAYGYNRADWSYIPGGVVSGTALIRPDFPELKEFPYLWQQTEYVMGGGSSNYMFLVLAADQLLNKTK